MWRDFDYFFYLFCVIGISPLNVSAEANYFSVVVIMDCEFISLSCHVLVNI